MFSTLLPLQMLQRGRRNTETPNHRNQSLSEDCSVAKRLKGSSVTILLQALSVPDMKRGKKTDDSLCGSVLDMHNQVCNDAYQLQGYTFACM